MAFTQSFDNQSSDLRISVMVVDDDPVFLGILSRMLEKFIYIDPSIMGITVIAVKDPIEALSTLRNQRHNLDLVVTDFYMPRMNGIQLKKQITREFGDIPVIVMSSDSNKEQESLACGAMCFLAKPISSTDLPKIYQVALSYKKKDKSISWPAHNPRDRDVCIPQQTQLLPEQANALKSKTKRFKPRSDTNNGSNVSTGDSGKNQKKKSNDGSGDNHRPLKKPKITWTNDLHDHFLKAIRHIGHDSGGQAKENLRVHDLPNLTRENIASHLQKYRLFLGKVAELGFSCSEILSMKGVDSLFLQAHLRDSYYNNYTSSSSSSRHNKSSNNRSLCSKPEQGYGQSRLLSNTAEPVRFNYMNRSSSTYEARGIGSNLTLATKTNINFPTQPSPNEGRRSLFEPIVMANKASQTSQVMRFGQHGLSATNGDSFNNNMMCSYASSTPNQPRMSSHVSVTPNQQGMNSYGISTSIQPGMKIHRSLTPGQQGIIGYENLTSNQPGINSNGILSPNPQGLDGYGSLTPNNSRISSYEISTSNQLGLNSYGSVNHNARVNSYESLTPNQEGLSNFLYGSQLFLNNENTAYKPPQPHVNEPTHANHEIRQPENQDLYDYLCNIDEVPCDISNFHFDHNKQQGAVPTTQFELLENLETELNQMLSLEENVDRNINQGHSDGETPNVVAAPVMNFPSFDMNPNHDQEQDVHGLVDWPSVLDPKDLANEYDFTDSLFTNEMN